MLTRSPSRPPPPFSAYVIFERPLSSKKRQDGCNKILVYLFRPHHALEDLPARQASLKFQYKFMCMCEACIKNWPTYFTLCAEHFSRVPATLIKAKNKILSADTIKNLQHGDLKTANKVYKRLCVMSELLEPYAPCAELCDCQESVKQCLCIFEGLSPYGSTQLIYWKDMIGVGGRSKDMEQFVTQTAQTFKKIVLGS